VNKVYHIQECVLWKSTVGILEKKNKKKRCLKRKKSKYQQRQWHWYKANENMSIGCNWSRVTVLFHSFCTILIVKLHLTILSKCDTVLHFYPSTYLN